MTLPRPTIRSLRLASLLVAAWMGTSWASGTVPAVHIAVDREHGSHLVDGRGRAYYLNVRDEDGSFLCLDACTAAWRPVRVRERIGFGHDVPLDLIGSIERSEGFTHLTYAGWPLYRFVDDREASAPRGHGEEGSWFLVGPAGAPVSWEEDAVAGGSLDERMKIGAGVYRAHCAECHGTDGNEAIDPRASRLAGNARAVSDAGRLVRQIVRGGMFMPRFEDRLTDVEVAAVATFVRNAWGNDEGPVSVEDVGDWR